MMKDDRRSNWLWVVVPFVLVLLLGVLWFLLTDPEAASPFQYSQ